MSQNYVNGKKFAIDSNVWGLGGFQEHIFSWKIPKRYTFLEFFGIGKDNQEK